jgi:hypothetical protein
MSVANGIHAHTSGKATNKRHSSYLRTHHSPTVPLAQRVTVSLSSSESPVVGHIRSGWHTQRREASHLQARQPLFNGLLIPFNTGFVPLDSDGKSGVNCRNHRGATAGHLHVSHCDALFCKRASAQRRAPSPAPSPRSQPSSLRPLTPCYSVGSVYAREKRKIGPDRSVPILNIWVIIVED